MRAREKPTAITLRTYRADGALCSLLSFAYPGGEKHVLIDVGSPRVVRDIAQRTSGQLEAVVITGRPARGRRASAPARHAHASADILHGLRPKRVVQPATLPAPDTGLEALLPGVKVHVISPPSAAAPPEKRAPSVLFPSARLRPIPQHLRWFVKRIEDAAADARIQLERMRHDAAPDTRLILVFEVGQTRLLFPGDAQRDLDPSLLAEPAHATLLSALTPLTEEPQGNLSGPRGRKAALYSELTLPLAERKTGQRVRRS